MSVKYQVVDRLLSFKSKPQLAKELGADPTTVRRWASRVSEPGDKYYEKMVQLQMMLQDQPVSQKKFTFIDLFAGIGGIRRAFQDPSIGGSCVFTSEWDEYAQKTYVANYPSNEQIFGDITKVDIKDIPDHDVLLAGFPCQPFSIAGVSKKNSLGRAHGFLDEAQGTLFFDVARIIAAKRPKVFVLENVKNLKSHDKGNTFKVIWDILSAPQLGYSVSCRVIDGQHFVPQHRERIIIVGVRSADGVDLDKMILPPKGQVFMKEILHKTDGSEERNSHDGDRYFDFNANRVADKYTLTDKLWKYLQDYAAKHKANGNGFGFGLVDENSVARTLSARYYKDGSEILVAQEGKNPRRLTPRECARLMGYPDSFEIPVSDTRAYKQFGNSVVVPVFHAVAEFILPYILQENASEPCEESDLDQAVGT